MIRSLVVPHFDSESNGERVIQRNLSQEKLEEAAKSECILWVDVINPSDEEINWLEHCFELHPAVVQDIKRADRRPTLMIYPNYMFLSLFQPRIQVDRVLGEEIHCLIGANYFVTIRSEESSSIYSAYERAAHNLESWDAKVRDFLYLTTQFVIDAYYPLLDRISTRLDSLEEKVLDGEKEKASQQILYRTKQQLISLRQMIAPQREVLSNLIGEERLGRTPENRELFNHLYERLLRIYDMIDSQRDLAGNVLDLMQSQESSRLANAVSRLTVLSMIFLPITFMVELFGLNFVMADDQFVIPFPGVTVFMAMIIATIGISASIYLFFRRKSWL